MGSPVKKAVRSKDEWPPHTAVNNAIPDMLKWEETISLNLNSSTESRRFGKQYRLKNVKNIYLVEKRGLSQ